MVTIQVIQVFIFDVNLNGWSMFCRHCEFQVSHQNISWRLPPR